ncbi:MAG: XTP/dITP diphosphatase [Thermodesulfobacteriota bacterium]
MTTAGTRLILATRNSGKLREVKEILRGLPVEVVGLGELPGAPEVVEDGLSFAENARKKAHALAAWSGSMALADDSGLEVDALDGRPGVHSARYAGEGATDQDNVRKLLEEMRGIPAGQRGARFRCVMVLAAPDGREWNSEGTWEGLIAEDPRGTGGFGYDPVFLVPQENRTAAELLPEEKNRMSHRAMALMGMREVLAGLLGP